MLYTYTPPHARLVDFFSLSTSILSKIQRTSGPPEVIIANSVVHMLATELSNYRHTVRSTAKRAIELMASAKGCLTTDILAPCRAAVEAHIFSKQLRAVQVYDAVMKKIRATSSCCRCFNAPHVVRCLVFFKYKYGM